MLIKDPTTYTYAKLRDWDYPVSREWFALADLWDLTLASHVKKKDFKPYPRPYKNDNKNSKNNTYGDVSELTESQVRNRLQQMNPKKEQ
jgi:hypothetical protein